MRHSPVLSAVLLAVSAPFALHAQSGEVAVEKDILVAMRDGTRLATDVYRPLLQGKPDPRKLPVILTRTPYDKAGVKKHGEYFAAHGYVFVAQDTRGRYASEGVWRWLTDDAPDGVDCAQWILKQDWADGKIGTLGFSYTGGTQHTMALEKAPGLASLMPIDAASNCGRQSMRNAGAFELRFWNWIMTQAAKGSHATRDPATASVLKELADNRLQYLHNLPLRKGTTPLRLAPEYEEWLVEAMRHGRDDAFWAQANVLDRVADYKDVPVYLVGGWYDSWAGNTTANYSALSKALKSEVFLLMGPWIHGMQAKSAHGQVDFGPDAAIADEPAWRLAWYDRSLKAQRTPSPFFDAKVRYFTMGTGDGRRTPEGLLFHGGTWRSGSQWPPAEARPVKFHLLPGGRLADKIPEQNTSPSRFTFDPKNPVPTIGGNISAGDGILLQGAWNQKGDPKVWNWPHPVPLSARNDVLVFQTAPLERDVEVTGELEVKLWIASSAPDTDFTAKLVDVYPASSQWPDGFDLNLADGICRARFRDSLKEEKPLEPGRVYPLTIKLYPTSNVFKKGHRIRVDVSSSNFPRFDVNPNTGEPLNEQRHSQSALNSVYHDADHPSHILLPVVGAR